MFINKKLVRNLFFMALLSLVSQTMVAVETSPVSESDPLSQKLGKNDLLFVYWHNKNDPKIQGCTGIREYIEVSSKFPKGSFTNKEEEQKAHFDHMKKITAAALAFIRGNDYMTFLILGFGLNHYYNTTDASEDALTQMRVHDRVGYSNMIARLKAQWKPSVIKKYCAENDTECHTICLKAFGKGLEAGHENAETLLKTGLLEHQKKTSENYKQISAQELIKQFGPLTLIKKIEAQMDAYLKEEWPETHIGSSIWTKDTPQEDQTAQAESETK